MNPKLLEQAQRLLKHPLIETFQFYEKAGLVEEEVMYLWDGTRFRADWVDEDLAEYVGMVRGMGDPVETRAYLDALIELKEHPIVVLEVGAGGGRYAIHALRYHPDARAVLVEAHPRHYQLTCDHMLLNGVTEKSRIIHAAIGAQEGRILTFLEAGYGSCVHPSGDILVPTVSVDGLMRDLELPLVDILHMDVQGAEVDVLKGAKQALLNYRINYLFIGTHSEELHTECKSTLGQYGYTLLRDDSPSQSEIGGDGLLIAKASEQVVKNTKVILAPVKKYLAEMLRSMASWLEVQ